MPMEDEGLCIQAYPATCKGQVLGAGLFSEKFSLDSFPAALLGCYRI
jgi:hypothetical protein